MITAITGASGHIGGNLVRALLKQKGLRIRVLSRKDTRAFDGLNVEVIQGDVADLSSLNRLFKGAGTVFNLAARISIVGSEGGLVNRTNIQGTRNIIEACKKNKVKRLVHFSSIHAYSDCECVTEKAPLSLDPRCHAYDYSKAVAQDTVIQAAKKGLNAVVVNPTSVIGPFDFKPSRMGAVVLDIYKGRFPILVDGGFDWVDVRDVVNGALLAEKKGRKGESYLLSGHWAHIREISVIIEELTGRKTVKAAMPLWFGKAVAVFPLLWGKITGLPAKFTPEAMDALCSHKNVSSKKAAKELGYRARPFRETIRDTLDWFQRNGYL